jgi:hypothetical protein
MARDRCRAERPAALPAGAGRRSACHYRDELIAKPQAPPRRSPALERRLALYRAAADNA